MIFVPTDIKIIYQASISSRIQSYQGLELVFVPTDIFLIYQASTSSRTQSYQGLESIFVPTKSYRAQNYEYCKIFEQ
nr:MAG TPA: hypothetical protein [Caudoviricetes sp.]